MDSHSYSNNMNKIVLKYGWQREPADTRTTCGGIYPYHCNPIWVGIDFFKLKLLFLLYLVPLGVLCLVNSYFLFRNRLPRFNLLYYQCLGQVLENNGQACRSLKYVLFFFFFLNLGIKILQYHKD